MKILGTTPSTPPSPDWAKKFNVDLTLQELVVIGAMSFRYESGNGKGRVGSSLYESLPTDLKTLARELKNSIHLIGA